MGLVSEDTASLALLIGGEPKSLYYSVSAPKARQLQLLPLSQS